MLSSLSARETSSLGGRDVASAADRDDSREAAERQRAADLVAWARRRADEILAGAALDAELLPLVRGDDAAAEQAPPHAPPEPQAPQPATVELAELEPEPELAAVPDLPPPPPAWQPPPTSMPSLEILSADPPASPRRYPRYDFAQPVRIRHEHWSEVVDLVTKDISHGGMFVETAVPPALHTKLTVCVMLPGGAGELTAEGEVVHVVSAHDAAASGRHPGFGLEFSRLTPERRRLLDRLVGHARDMAQSSRLHGPTLEELGFVCSSSGSGLRLTLNAEELDQLRELNEELGNMRQRGDLELLGLGAGADLQAIRDAFLELKQRWHPDARLRRAAPEVRKLALEIYLRLEQAYGRLRSAERVAIAATPTPAPMMLPTPAPTMLPTPAPTMVAEAEDPGVPSPIDLVARPRVNTVRAPRPTARTPPESTARPEVATPAVLPDPAPTPSPGVPRPVPRDDSSPPGLARQHVRGLLERGGRLARKLSDEGERTPAAGIPAAEFNALIGRGFEDLTARRYEEAAEAFAEAVRRRPESNKAKILQLFALARLALRDKDFAAARRHYESVLAIDPSNATAKRDLVMLDCLR